MLTVKLIQRGRFGWNRAATRTLSNITPQEAAQHLAESKGKTFETTRPGDWIVQNVSGTLADLFAAYTAAGYTNEEISAAFAKP